MSRYTIIRLYAGIVVFAILALQSAGLHGWPWLVRALVLPVVPVAIMALAARRRMARGDQGRPPWEARDRPAPPPTSTE